MSAARNNGVFGSSGSSDPGESGKRDPNGPGQKRAGSRSKAPDAAPDAKQCKAKMLQLLGARDYSEKMMRERLAKAGFSKPDVDTAVRLALDLKLIDDARYAELFISSRRQLGWGRSRIERELKAKGVDCASIPGYPDEFFTPGSELERARALLRSHRTSAKDVRASHYRYLASKGFDHATCMRALSEEGF